VKRPDVQIDPAVFGLKWKQCSGKQAD